MFQGLAPPTTTSHTPIFAREVHNGLESVSNSFVKDPIGSARILAENLTPAQRSILLSALDKKSAENPPLDNDRYVSELFRAADTTEPKGLLNR